MNTQFLTDLGFWICAIVFVWGVWFGLMAWLDR